MQFSDNQAASRIELDGGIVLTKCDQCRGMHAERNPPTEPPCEICSVDLAEENRDAVRIFSIVRNQYIMGMNGPISINHLAVWKAIEKYGIQKERETFEKIIRLSSWNLNEMMKKDEDK